MKSRFLASKPNELTDFKNATSEALPSNRGTGSIALRLPHHLPCGSASGGSGESNVYELSFCSAEPASLTTPRLLRSDVWVTLPLVMRGPVGSLPTKDNGAAGF